MWCSSNESDFWTSIPKCMQLTFLSVTLGGYIPIPMFLFGVFFFFTDCIHTNTFVLFWSRKFCLKCVLLNLTTIFESKVTRIFPKWKYTQWWWNSALLSSGHPLIRSVFIENPLLTSKQYYVGQSKYNIGLKVISGPEKVKYGSSEEDEVTFLESMGKTAWRR